MNKILEKPIFWICAAVVCLAIGFYWLNHHGEETKAKAAQKNVLSTGTIDPSIKIPQGVEQQVIPLQKGNLTDYSTPTPTPESLPTPLEKHKVKLASLILVDTIPTPTPTPRADPPPPRRWLSESMYIPCVLLPEIDSGHGKIIIVGFVTQDIWCLNYGVANLILPAGTRLMAGAEGGYRRDRIFSDDKWTAVFNHTGTSVKFKGTACNMEYDARTNMYGLLDKSPGIKGVLRESDQYARLEGFFQLLLKTGSSFVSSAGDAVLQRSFQGNGNNNSSFQVNAPPVDPLIDSSIKLLVNGHHTDINDTLYVQVPSCKAFWVLTLEPVYLDLASVGSYLQKEQEKKEAPVPDETMKAVNEIRSEHNKEENEETTDNSDSK